MRISDWSSDVCSSDLLHFAGRLALTRHCHRVEIDLAVAGIEDVRCELDGRAVVNRLDAVLARNRFQENLGGHVGQMREQRLAIKRLAVNSGEVTPTAAGLVGPQAKKKRTAPAMRGGPSCIISEAIRLLQIGRAHVNSSH